MANSTHDNWSNDTLQRAFRVLQVSLVENVKAEDLTDALFAANILSAKDIEDLKCVPNPTERIRNLLMLLHNSNNTETFVQLRKALTQRSNREKFGWLLKDVERRYKELEQSEAVTATPSSRTTERTIEADSRPAAAAAGTRNEGDAQAKSRQTTKLRRSSKSNKSEPKVTHVIAAVHGRAGDVGGLAVYNNELFVVRTNQTFSRLEVYSTTDYAFQRYIRLNQLGHWSAYGLAACSTNKCLYVSDSGNKAIHRLQLTAGGNDVTTWTVYGSPVGLLVNNSTQNLLIAFACVPDKVVEYTTRGEVVREVLLYDGVLNPEYAVQLDESRYAVSHWGLGLSPHRVCVVDAYGRVQLSYGSSPGSETERLHSPKHLAFNKKRGRLYVADMMNNRIVILYSETLKWSRDLAVSVDRPFAVCFDEAKKQLFVGESNSDSSRVLVVNL